MTEDRMAYAFRPAARSEAKPLIGLYAESGAGKTYSALLLARGFVGPEGKIGMVETESGRGEAYADPTEYPEIGGYQVLSLRDDFSPVAYGKAITAAELAHIDALIIDSASHEWEGVGGVLDMAAKNEAGGKRGVLVWQQPKIDHKRYFMLRFMQTSIPLVILCMRAKYPMREVKRDNGKKEWVRSEKLEPTQADDILFEMFVHGWIGQTDHKFHLTKCTAKALEPVFHDGAPLTAETGEALRAWAGGQAGERPSRTQAAPLTANGHVNELISEAEAKAREGSEAFRTWWPGLPRAKKEVLSGQLTRLKDIAFTADDLLSNPPPPEDPFASPTA